MIEPSPPDREDDRRLAPGVEAPPGCLRWSFARASGPGGQNVNKRSTKAELRVRPAELPLRPGALARLLHAGRGYLTDQGELLITADEHRSQAQNKAECLERLRALVLAAMVEPKIRRKTRPTRGSKERRLGEKKRRGEIKRSRGGGGGGAD
jgi:ribosome-associated protein